MIEDRGRLADPAWAWAAYEPDDVRPWNLRLAGHLYRRAGFGANWQQLQQAISDGPRETVSHLLHPEADTESFGQSYDVYEEDVGSVNGLRAWWLRRMIETPYPLQEKMTLFWHGHFATDDGVLKQARLMRDHIQLLRRHALGSFDSLLKAMTHDPALLQSLGADANRKAMPNESFVRPLMETFTLGPGQFSDEDVREAARAFTGWFVLRDRLRYIPREHDDGPKRILGCEDRFTGEDVIRMVLEQKATHRTLVCALYHWFISETDEPNDELIAPLAKSLAQDYSISGVVETMLRSNLFFSPCAYRQKVKSPVEFAVGIVSALEGMVSTTQLAEDVARLGQALCRPPTVRGWSGGRDWIDSITLTRRHNLSLSLLQGEGPYGGRLNPWALAQRNGCATVESAAQLLLDLFLQNDVASDVRESLLQTVRDNAPTESLDRLTQSLVTLPEYHLT